MTLSFWPNKLMFKGAERASMRWPEADVMRVCTCNYKGYSRFYPVTVSGGKD